MWVDFKKHVPSDIRIREYITRTCGVLVSDGYGYGGEAFASFGRINLSTSMENLEDGLKRIINGLKDSQ